ncbi:MAG: cytoplasmic protein [Thermodesulfobacteriota bacterium]
MQKYALFVFNGDPMCFVHVLLNALDMHARDNEVKIVMEGASTKLLPGLANREVDMYEKWEKVKKQGLVAGVCRACSHQMGTRESAEAQGLALLADMYGHPGMAAFRQAGYEIITF